jgi:hypothetical protein
MTLSSRTTPTPNWSTTSSHIAAMNSRTSAFAGQSPVPLGSPAGRTRAHAGFASIAHGWKRVIVHAATSIPTSSALATNSGHAAQTAAADSLGTTLP